MNTIHWNKVMAVIVINGKPTNTYTFKYDYYWMMGDNRHRSQDSRFWGLFPKHILWGKLRLSGLAGIKGQGGAVIQVD
jgi:signal peptidase I